MFTREVQQEPIEQHVDVTAAFAQAGHFHRHDLQPVQQVFTKARFSYQLIQVLMGCGNDARINLGGLAFINRYDFTRFEEAQELGLSGQGQFTDFIQEQRAAMRAANMP